MNLLNFLTPAIKKWVESNRLKNKFVSEEDEIRCVQFLLENYRDKNSINFSYEQCHEKIQAKLTTQKINPNLDPGETETLMELSNNFKFCRLIDRASREWEALYMHHCIGSDLYEGHQGIYSLRDGENIPHATIKIENHQVTSIKGFSNGTIKPKYINYIIEIFKKFNYDLNNSTLINMGYLKISDKIRNYLVNYFSPVQLITINNNEFLYINNKLDLIKKMDFYDEDLFLHFCEQNGSDADLFYNFLELGANLRCRDFSPLILAAKSGNLALLKIIESSGIDLHYNNELPFRVAAASGKVHIVEYFLKLKTDINANESEAVWSAALNGRLNVVKTLVQNGINYHAKNELAFRLACDKGHLEIVKYFCDIGVDIEAENNYAIRWARAKNHYSVVKFLEQSSKNNKKSA